MLDWLLRARSRNAIPDDLYGAIVTQARTVALYADFGVPDTVPGRFEMVVLHAALVLKRLEGGTEAERALAGSVYQVFCADMDATLREFGVNDAVMHARMKKMAQGFSGRATAYGAAVDGQDREAMLAALTRNVFPGGEGAPAPGLVDYAFDAWRTYEAIPSGALAAGAGGLPPIEVAGS